MRVVVTGATGNIGTSLLAALVEHPGVREIVGVARRAPDLSYPRTCFEAADVAADDLDPVFEGADVVVHLAWRLQPSRRTRALERTNVEGSRRVFEAARRAGASALVYASSVGAYSGVAEKRFVDEEHPTEGISTSTYSRQKARVEAILDRFERRVPEIRVVRLRPALAFKREAAWGIRRMFLGPLVPALLFDRGLPPILPGHPRLRVQAVHSRDLGEAFARAVTGDVSGSFNVAAPPVLGAAVLAERTGGRAVRLSPGLVRGAAAAAYHMRLIPTEPGWVDLARAAPLMRTDRARAELGWRPERSADRALADLLEGLGEGASLPTPPLRPQRGRALGDLVGLPERVEP